MLAKHEAAMLVETGSPSVDPCIHENGVDRTTSSSQIFGRVAQESNLLEQTFEYNYIPASCERY